MTGPRRFWLVAALALLGRPGLPSHAQPADESPAAMDARLAAAAVTRVGPSYLYPDHATTPGVVNPDITQPIRETICARGWTSAIAQFRSMWDWFTGVHGQSQDSIVVQAGAAWARADKRRDSPTGTAPDQLSRACHVLRQERL